ncbi:MAG: ABC transporter substrate-binding protein [Pseudomonadota bacterium]
MKPARLASLGLAGLLALGCVSQPPAPRTPLVPIRVAGARWIELSPVVVAANSFYPQQLTVPAGGVVSITAGSADLATNAETQLLRESVANPDLRIIMTVAESFYRLVGRRSAGISKLADLKGKRVAVPRMTSAQYYLVAMLRSAGLKEEDVTLVNLPQGTKMSDALLHGDVDVIATFEPEPGIAMQKLGKDAIQLQDRKVYREAFNLHARATDLADPQKRRAIVAFVRAAADATQALKKNPQAYWPYISSVIGFAPEEIALGWPETRFPVRIIPDMLDVLDTEELWVAKASNRAPRGRAELAKFIDRSVVDEALALR